MALSAEIVGTAVAQTMQGEGEGSLVQRFSQNLQQSAAETVPSDTSNPFDAVTLALLNPESSKEDRRPAFQTALSAGQRTIIQGLGLVNVVKDPEALLQEAKETTHALIESTLTVATSFPQPVEHDSSTILGETLSPKKQSVDQKVRSAVIVTDLMTPFLVNRLLDLNIYDAADTATKVQTLVADLKLLGHFYNSIKFLIEYLHEGDSPLSKQEIADQLFETGPVFAKLIQKFAGSFTQGDGIGQDLEELFQEGIKPPSEAEVEEIRSGLPSGLRLNKTMSSASVAFIVGTQDQINNNYATKVSRPGIDTAKTNNMRTLAVLSETLISFVREHASNTPLAQQLEVVQTALPYFLAIIESDIDQEQNFEEQIVAQKRARAMVANHPGIIVPQIIDAFSDSQHITMSIELSEPIKALPANQKYLTNIFTLCLELIKNRFWHSDMHGRNIKGRQDGSIVAYDWGQIRDLPDRFFRHLGSYLWGLARMNPQATAKAYCRIQNPNDQLLDEPTVAQLAREVFESQKQLAASSAEPRPGFLSRLYKTQELMALTLALRHQSALDERYLAFSASAYALSKVVKAELTKAAYEGRGKKPLALAASFVKAIRAVYF